MLSKAWSSRHVVGAGVFLNLNHAGIYYSASLYLLHFKYSFQTTKPVTGLIISLLLGSFYFAGLVSGPLVIRFGARSVAIVGAFMNSIGLVLSAFASSVYMLYFSFGILTGFGLGLLTSSVIINIQQHTSKWRTLASGVSYAGGSLGGLTYPFIFRWTEAAYGWRGSLIIMGGLQLNNLPAAMFLLPVSAKKEADPDENIQMHQTNALEGQANNEIEANPQMKIQDNPGDKNPKCQVLSCDTYNPMHNEYTGTAHKDDKAGCKKEKKNTYLSIVNELNRLLRTLHSGGIASILCISANICRITASGFLYSFLPIRVAVLGLSSNFAPYLLSTVSLGELAGRLLGGAVASFHDRLPLILLVGAAFMAGVLEALLGLAQTETMLVVTVAVLGGFFGVATSLLPPVTRDIVGLGNLPWVMGLSWGIAGFGYLPILQFLVWIWIKTGNITLMFISAGVIYAGAGLSLTLYICLRGWPDAINKRVSS